ncbi:fimbrillin family protein [Phocaeicola plebeius]|uniref:fimbrillin family protein n=1 Tax=Phocaeicola plebeius TaxID=310297 RepID=UPI0019574AF0|nr:fimbrillin family protein [Phocaeicola plebeius]MBM6962639.1 fimbrillin family protein [Phocaeicola plebeius]
MKTRIIGWMGITLSSIWMAGCSQEQILDPSFSQEDGTALSVTATSEGFVDTDNLSRVTDEGTSTTFEDGDKMGLYVVGADKVILKNIPLTYSEGKWTADRNIYYYEGADYVAYFPYNESLETASSASEGETLTETVEAGIKAAGDEVLQSAVNQDQNTYHKADLMMAKVASTAISEQSLNFKLEHQYALVEFALPVYKFKYLKANSDSDYKEFSVPMTDFTMKVNGTEVTPYKTPEGTFRYLIQPGTKTTLSDVKFTDPSDSKPVTVKEKAVTLDAGNYKRYNVSINVDGTTQTPSSEAEEIDLIGCFLCDDGTIWPNKWKENVPSNVVGIIYSQIGEGDLAGSDIADKDFNYYALAVNEVKGFGFDKTDGAFVFPDNVFRVASDDSGIGNIFSIQDMSGYQSTQALIGASIGTSIKGALERWSKPENMESSGWFIPSAGQYWKLTNLVGTESLGTPEWTNSSRYGFSSENAVSTKLKELTSYCHRDVDGDRTSPVVDTENHNYWTLTRRNALNGFNETIYCLGYECDGQEGNNRFYISYVNVADNDNSSLRYIRPIIAF